jgi:hypothetical protein
MDLLVTRDLYRGTIIAFRFYPHDDGYLSFQSSSTAFPLSAPVTAGSFLRLRRGPGTTMELCTRTVTETTWTVSATATTRPAIPPYASCMVYSVPTCGAVEALSFIGVVDADGVEPIPPPTTVLPCQFAIIVDLFAPAVDGDYYVYYRNGSLGIMGSWCAAWQLLKWPALGAWVAAGADEVDPNAEYNDNVTLLENRLSVVLTPGQVTPIAYRPYNFVDAPAFAAQWALVCTRTIPANTEIYIVPNRWLETVSKDDAWWVWSSSWDTPAGTVIDLTGLGPAPMFGSPSASVGGISTLPARATGVDVLAFTAFSVAFTTAAPADDAHRAVPITATYSCSYRGEKPANLQPGVAMLRQPWPTCASILPVSSCGRVPLVTASAAALNNMCPVRWVLQVLPTFRIQLPGDAAACAGGCGTGHCTCCTTAAALPSTVSAGTVTALAMMPPPYAARCSWRGTLAGTGTSAAMGLGGSCGGRVHNHA